jgi:O-antigen/teichoic acid export membrane protein
MTNTLRQKTVSGLTWSFIDTAAGQGIQFIVGIILARMLTPREFGLIGMITIFIAVSESFINSGFSSALIRKKDCTSEDYSTVFFFNLTAGVAFFILLFLTAPAISLFFKEPELKSIIQVLGIVLIIDSATLIQRTILTKQINFKLQTRISVIAAIGSGTLAIGMAYSGFGVWSLVAQRLCKQAINSFFLWLWNKWKPIAVFSRQSFRELFGFGSKLLASGLIDTIYRNVYYLIIGKFFTAKELGYYTRADQFNALPSQSLTGVIGRVSYPVLSSIQDDPQRLKTSYQRLIRSTMFITFILMVGMAAVAEPMVVGLIGEKWKPSVTYLQMLCFAGMLYPLHALNLNMLQVKGRSDLFLRLEVIKKSLAVPVIVIGVFWGIKAMIAGMILNSIIALYLNSYWSGRLIGYPFRQQLYDILPSFTLSVAMAISVYLLGLIIPFPPIIKLLIQVTAGAVFILLFSEMAKFKDYLFIKELVKERIQKHK